MEENNNATQRSTPVTPSPRLVGMVRAALDRANAFGKADVFYHADGQSALIYNGPFHMLRLDVRAAMPERRNG